MPVARAAAQAVRPRLRAPVGSELNVLNGCEGKDIAFLMAAAMLVAPLPLLWRLRGLAAGLRCVWPTHQVRVLVRFHSFRHNRNRFV